MTTTVAGFAVTSAVGLSGLRGSAAWTLLGSLTTIRA